MNRKREYIDRFRKRDDQVPTFKPDAPKPPAFEQNAQAKAEYNAVSAANKTLVAHGHVLTKPEEHAIRVTTTYSVMPINGNQQVISSPVNILTDNNFGIIATYTVPVGFAMVLRSFSANRFVTGSSPPSISGQNIRIYPLIDGVNLLRDNNYIEFTVGDTDLAYYATAGENSMFELHAYLPNAPVGYSADVTTRLVIDLLPLTTGDYKQVIVGGKA